MPSREVFSSLVAAVRADGNVARGRTSGDWLEFLAFSGLRVGELRRLRWEDVDLSGGRVFVRGGRDGAKSWECRWVPMIPALVALVVRMQAEWLSVGCAVEGPVFRVLGARRALAAGCESVGFPRLRQHDLRHLFATSCLESGVEAATLAVWLGHQDGGALVLRTYGHVRPEHGRLAAARVVM